MGKKIQRAVPDHVKSKVILVNNMDQGIACVNELIPKFLNSNEGANESVLFLGFEEAEAKAVCSYGMRRRTYSKDAYPINEGLHREKQLKYQLLAGLRYTDPDLIIARCRDSHSTLLLAQAIQSGHMVYLICDQGESLDGLIQACKQERPSFDADHLLAFIDVIDRTSEDKDIEDLGGFVVKEIKSALSGAFQQAPDRKVSESKDKTSLARENLGNLFASEFFREVEAGDRAEGKSVPEYEDVVGCGECGTPLSDEERYYYEYRCESCERAWHERIQEWRANPESDKELNEMFKAPPEDETDPGNGSIH